MMNLRAKAASFQDSASDSKLLQKLLKVGEMVYQVGLGGIKLAYQKELLKIHRLPAPVVSVGNLTWGGTGKTPLTIHLAKEFTRMGRRVAVLTRGYGRDESRLMKERLDPIPVLVNPDRVEAGTEAVKVQGANLLLLDDGYQQWRLQKDVDILSVDGTDPFGNGHLIPRGSLREPMEEAKRADLIVIKRGTLDVQGLEALTQKLRRFNSTAPIFTMRYEPTELWRWPTREKVDLKTLKGQRICTLAGIAHPEQFETTVNSLVGQGAALKHRAADHHPYTSGELVNILMRCQKHGIRKIVTTAKDAVRIPKLFIDTVGPDLRGLTLLVLEVEIKLEPNEGEFLHRIDSVLAGKRN